ncbi:MAG TPA: FtsX-like permease family protein [Candidatus Limnocylindrales bacterium]
MLKTALAGVRSHARRLVGTVLAAVLGVGFVTGTLIFGDSVREGYFQEFARTAQNADAVISSPSPEDVSRISGLSTVEEVDVRVVASLPLLDREGRPFTNFGRVGVAVPSGGPATLRAFDIEGRAAAGPGEALLDKETAAHLHYAVGDTITVLDSKGARVGLRLVGLMDFGVSKALSGTSVVGLPIPEITALTGTTEINEVAVTARPGVSPDALVDSLRTVTGAKVITGDQRRIDLANEATAVAGQLTFILLIFGVISLVVAVFVIYNTFAILLVQRIRETALLRCVGATRRQVLGSTLAEAALVGLVGSVLGLLLGVGVAHALPIALTALGNPIHDVIVAPSSLLIGLITGVVSTVLAALLPALRATRIPPMAALRSLPLTPAGRRALPRALLALLVGSLGIAVTVFGWRQSDSQAGTFVIVAGGCIVFLALLIASPLFIGPIISAAGAPLRPLTGTAGRIAIANARRNPGRSAVTASALMIGIGLMALFSVLISSIQATADVQIGLRYPVDYVISGLRHDSGESVGLPPALAEKLRSRSEFTTVIQTRAVPMRIGTAGGAVDGTVGSVSTTTGDSVLVRAGRPWAQDLKPGDTITVSLRDKEFPLTVTGFTEEGIPGDGDIDLQISWEALTRIAGTGDAAAVMVKARDGVSAVASRDILEELRADFPLIDIGSIADLSDDLEEQVAGIVALFGGILGLTVLISLFGIANTLSLSVFERTRESAMMRAIGLTRGQLRGTLLLEAVLLGITAGSVGVAFGLIYGRIVVLKAISVIGATIAVPWSWLFGLLAMAAVASLLAAVLPARRAAGASIVAAMSDT